MWGKNNHIEAHLQIVRRTSHICKWIVICDNMAEVSVTFSSQVCNSSYIPAGILWESITYISGFVVYCTYLSVHIRPWYIFSVTWNHYFHLLPAHGSKLNFVKPITLKVRQHMLVNVEVADDISTRFLDFIPIALGEKETQTVTEKDNRQGKQAAKTNFSSAIPLRSCMADHVTLWMGGLMNDRVVVIYSKQHNY